MTVLETTSTKKVKVLVMRCNSHIGQYLCRLIDKSQNFKVQYALDNEVWEWPNYCLCTSFEEVEDLEELPDIIIDFSNPGMSMKALLFAKKHTVPIIIGTSGFSETEQKIIYDCSKDIPIFVLSANSTRGIKARVDSSLDAAEFLIGKTAGFYTLADLEM